MIVLYGITLIHLAEELRVVDSRLLSLFYTYYVAFDGSARRSAHLLKLLTERGTDQGYFPKLTKLILYQTHGGKRSRKGGNLRRRG